MILINCPNCAKMLKVPETFRGKKVACPGCRYRVEIPLEEGPANVPEARNPAATPFDLQAETLPPVSRPPAIPPATLQPVGDSASTPPGTVAVGCPGCGRAISLLPGELTLEIECSKCGTRFVPMPAPAPPPRRVPKSGVQSAADAMGELAEEREGSYRPVSVQRSLPMPVLIGGGAAVLVVMAIVCGGVLVAVAGNSNNSGPGRGRYGSGPAHYNSAASDTAAAGASLFLFGLLCTLPILYLVTVILLLAWVARDARARGVDGGAVWVLVILLTHVVGLIIYLAARPQGALVVCPRCGNKRLMAGLTCPHCGQASAA